MRPERRRDALAAAAVAATSILPFLPALVRGHVFYFRDLWLYFFPLRRFAVEGLRAGELRWWNPFEHEGVPLALPVVSYPLDLLQVLWADERGFTLLLALHVPLAALAAFGLASGLRLSRSAAATAGLCYALGGFALSSLNLYVHLQALAWAPLLVLGLLRAAAGGPRRIAGGALAVAVCLSTTGVEVAAQAVAVAVILKPAVGGRWRSLGASLLLGIAVAAAPLALLAGLVPGSARAGGFPTEVTLAHSVHPLTLVQVLVAGLYSDTSRIVDAWWGQNFFPRGFPYFLSLYLGPTAVAAAMAGAIGGGRLSRRLAVLAAAALVICLGRWAGFSVILDAVPSLRVFRFPSKAFFTVHLAAALLVALAVHALHGAAAGAWRRLGVLAAALGAPLLLLRGWWELAPAAWRWFLNGFFPPGMSGPERTQAFDRMMADASAGAAVALCVAGLALAVHRRRLPAPAGAFALAALIAADLLRAGAGLNPSLPPAALAPSAPSLALAQGLRDQGGRVLVCPVEESPAYLRERERRGGAPHAVWSLRVAVDTLTPSVNVPLAVPTAYGADRTMLVPRERLLAPGEGCAAMATVLRRLRAAGVAHVVSLDGMEHDGLRYRGRLPEDRLAPLAVHVYEVSEPSPLREVTHGRVLASRERPTALELDVEATAPSDLIVRDAFAPGWRAAVDGRPAGLVAHEGHRRVALPPGRHRVTLRYRPPGLGWGATVSAAALSFVGVLLVQPAWARRRRAP